MSFTLALGVFYLLAIAALIFILLFGEHQAFRGTLVERANACFNGGLCSLCSAGCVRLCGPRCRSALDAASDCCLERPNPALQLVYLLLVTVGYVIFLTSAWPLLPGPYAGEEHRWLGPACTLLSLLLFFATCFSDPGIITAENVMRHLDAYPFDGTLYTPKRCPTMRIPAPARSKFSRITNRRVARFDHFCAWMNNDIGEGNYRYFLGFLATHVLLTAYGAWLCFALLAGELVRHGVLDAVVGLDDGREVPLREAPLTLAQFAIATYAPLAMLGLFLGLTCLLVTSFLGYHLSLVASNVTTNEQWKRKDLREWLEEEAVQKLKAEGGGEAEVVEPPRGVRRRLFGGLCGSGGERKTNGVSPELRAQLDAKCRNVYHQGLWKNVLEVLLARSMQSRAASEAAAEAKARRAVAAAGKEEAKKVK